MGAALRRNLYLATADGLYRAEPAGEGYDLNCIGFKGKGSFRAPVLVDKDDPNTLYASTTRSGMHRSHDSGKCWEETDNGLAYKDIWSIVQHPKTGTIIAGTCPTDAFMSYDRGDSWVECDQLQRLPTTKGWTGPVPPHVSRLKGISLHPEDPQLVYGAIEEGWAIRSLDGGKHWDQIDDGVDHDGHSIAVMPDAPHVVVASTGKGMFRSEDDGTHWCPSNAGLSGRHYTPAPLVMHPARPNVLLTAVTANGPGSWLKPEGGDTAFIRSDDQGQSWQMSTAGLPQPCTTVPRALAVDSEDPNAFFTGMIDGSIWFSSDGGESWRQLISGLPAVMGITVCPN
jgi:photosystem II stability/assembly factor-like uncharacterized protein